MRIHLIAALKMPRHIEIMAQDAINNLTAALRRHLQKEAGDGLYIASMDHSPSEQLTGAPWHTTALILSRGLEHATLAQSLGKRLRPRTGTLAKWRNATRVYKRCFLDAFFRELGSFPVYALAISATEASVSSSLNHFVSQLGLEAHYRPVEEAGSTPKISLGPFVRESTGETSQLVLAQNRAAMCLFIAHFVLRMHKHMYDAANIDRPNDPGHINWNFYGDKFPGPPGGDMDLMFQILLSLDRVTGRILWGYFREGDTVETDLLVDNVAGALNDVAARREPSLSFGEESDGLFYWERWM
jgi:hypothetical protein